MKLISSKLRIPTPRKNYIPRQRLFAKLSQLLDYKVVVVQGMAGSGKTTLLSSLLKERPELTCRWLSLDEGNNHLFSFWHYFMEAIKGDLGEESNNLLSIFASLPKNEMENFLILLVNQLHASEDLLIVLDDFHVIDDPHVLESLQFLIKYMPDSIHLVLLTRELPKLYFGELMMGGKYLEITEQDLRFSTTEAISFLHQTLGIHLDDEIAGKLFEITEGWVGGLQLLTLALGNKGEHLLEGVTVKGLNKYMIDYLSNEILNSVSKEEANFLIKTSILSYFDEEICNRLLKINNGATMINNLIEKNMFLITIDEMEGLYRYHHLFGQFLSLKFSALDEETKEQLHREAAIIFAERGDLDESIKHDVEIGNYRGALKQIENMGKSSKSWPYLRQIPLNFVSENRDLLLQRFFYHYCNLEFDGCREIIAYLKELDVDDPLVSILYFSKFLFEEDVSDLKFDFELFAEIDSLALSKETKAIIYLVSSTLLAIKDQFVEAAGFIDKAMALEREFHNPYIRFFVLSLKSQLRETLGDLRICERLYEELFRMVEDHPILAPLLVNNLIGVTGIYLKALRLEKAEQILKEASLKVGKNDLPMERGYVYNLLEFYLLKGDRESALKQLHHLSQFEVYNNPLYYSSVLRFQLILDAVDEQKLQNFLSLLEQQENQLLRYEDRMLYARILFLRGDRGTALAQIDEVLKLCRRYKIKLYLIEALLLKIVILDQEGEAYKREILNLIREAVHYSYENHIASPYLIEMKVVEKYLRLLLVEKEQDLNKGEIGFIRCFQTYWDTHDQKLDLLSEREQEVLQVLAKGFSNREIGEALCISVSTVKTHIINIYSKLQVSNRVEAVEKARKIGLLHDLNLLKM